MTHLSWLAPCTKVVSGTSLVFKTEWLDGRLWSEGEENEGNYEKKKKKIQQLHVTHIHVCIAEF